MGTAGKNLMLQAAELARPVDDANAGVCGPAVDTTEANEIDTSFASRIASSSGAAAATFTRTSTFLVAALPTSDAEPAGANDRQVTRRNIRTLPTHQALQRFHGRPTSRAVRRPSAASVVRPTREAARVIGACARNPWTMPGSEDR